MPTAEQAYAAVMEQYEKQGQLRYGSYIDPVFMPIDPQLVDKIDSEYNQLKVAWAKALRTKKLLRYPNGQKLFALPIYFLPLKD